MNVIESIKTGLLLGKYFTRKESAEESKQLSVWLKENPRHQKLFNKLKQEANIADGIEEFDYYNKENAWKRYMEKITTISLKRTLLYWKIAAVFFFLVGSAGIWTYISNEWNLLSSGNESYTTVTTNNGQHSKVILPDSSVVWLNSGTTLSYNTNFAAKHRDIKLAGQAYFTVSKNKKIPLIVSCDNLKIKVLGTRFDVSSYPENHKINVVLESGSVKLLHAQDKSFDYTLVPGEKAEFDLDRERLSVSKVEVYNYTSWKDGILIFKDSPMDEVIEKLKRWYNIQVEVKNKSIYDLIFNATIVNETMVDIFDLIKFTCSVNYQIIPSDNPEIPVKVILSN